MQNKIIIILIVLLAGSGYYSFSCWKDKKDAQKNEMLLLTENKKLQLIIAEQKIQCGTACQNIEFVESNESNEVVGPTSPVNVTDIDKPEQQTESLIQTEQQSVSNQNNIVNETQNSTEEENKIEKCINQLDQNSKVCQRANSLRMPATFADD